MNIVAVIAGLVDLAVSLLGRVNQLRQIAKQSGELSTEEEAALDKKMNDAFAGQAWQKSTPPTS